MFYFRVRLFPIMSDSPNILINMLSMLVFLETLFFDNILFSKHNKFAVELAASAIPIQNENVHNSEWSLWDVVFRKNNSNE